MPPLQNASPIPHIHALCMDDIYSTALQAAVASSDSLSSISITYHNCALSFVEAEFDLIVSPANSYGRLDGGFDDAISRSFSPRDDYLALTRAAQAKLYDEWRGFAPPGTCTLLRIPDDFHARSRNTWGTKYLALCPTMRVPQSITWDREVIYECTWSLLCAVDRHNRAQQKHDEIRSLLMVPMGTGVGGVSSEKWANQTALALEHYLDAVNNEARWSALEPDDITDYAREVQETWGL
ncbi:macro domain-like protein [Trichoderma citrinoviride]|uniref:Macro domain-like protein n=1 Tax=Trichoderma citrinoviride TaxID=58853 RepID=A0A2T4B2U4_9HYPO|nr:macro domain-like protein [Trichoderma citrinoviride]PTB63647.1 macro domain-like protein [Trichoderma citrinoviride]